VGYIGRYGRDGIIHWMDRSGHFSRKWHSHDHGDEWISQCDGIGDGQ
jgi:hypothetical protein